MTIKYWQITIMALAVTSLAFGGMSDAFALAELKVTTNAASIVVTDCFAVDCSGELDTDNRQGVVVTNLAPGNFPGTCAIFNLQAGLSKPTLPSINMPEMDLIFGTSSSVACDIEVLWTDTDFIPSDDVITCNGAVGGTTSGIFNGYSAYLDPANVMFSLADEVTNVGGPLGPGGFTASSSGFASGVNAPYSLTMKVEYSHGAVSTLTTGDANLMCDKIVGGTLLPISSQSLFLAGIQSMTVWMIPAVAGLAGAGIYLVKYRANRD